MKNVLLITGDEKEHNVPERYPPAADGGGGTRVTSLPLTSKAVTLFVLFFLSASPSTHFMHFINFDLYAASTCCLTCAVAGSGVITSGLIARCVTGDKVHMVNLLYIPLVAATFLAQTHSTPNNEHHKYNNTPAASTPVTPVHITRLYYHFLPLHSAAEEEYHKQVQNRPVLGNL